MITKAYLFWAGSGTPDYNVKLNGYSVNSQINGTGSIPEGYQYYGHIADVTNIVTGAGTYTVSYLDWNNGPPYTTGWSAFGNWSLVVVFQHPAAPNRNINIYQQWHVEWPTNLCRNCSFNIKRK